MIVVRVELHSAVTGKARELGRAIIYNVGGTETRGNYDALVLRKNATSLTQALSRGRGIVRRGRVFGYPRLSYNM